MDNNDKLYRPEYSLCRKDRTQTLPDQSTHLNRRQYSAHGGTLIYVHEHLHAEEIKLQDVTIEAISILAENRITNTRFCIVNTYRAQNFDIDLFFAKNLFYNELPPTIQCAHNSDWRCKYNWLSFCIIYIW